MPPFSAAAPSRPTDAAVPTADELHDLADLRLRMLVLPGQLCDAPTGEEVFHRDLPIGRIQGAVAVEQGDHERIVQAASEPADRTADRTGRTPQRPGDGAIAGADAEG